MAVAALQVAPYTREGTGTIRRIPGARFQAVGAKLLLVVLMAAAVVAWSPRYWPVALLHTSVFALGLAWLVANVARPAPGRWSPLFPPVFAAGVWGLLQLACGASVYRFPTSRATLYWSANAVVMFLAAQFLQDKPVRRNFLAVLAVFTGFIAVIGILQYFTSPYRIYWTFPIAQHVKAVGPFVYRNQFAALVELVLPLALYRVMDDRRQRWAFALLSAVLFAVVVATASRAGRSPFDCGS